jgi:glycosyltransferase involved in cell wall biosynthesis
MKTLIIVPAYNEAENITHVIDDIGKNFQQADILVVNDGSTDSTGEIAKEAGATVINHPFNLGIGAAMQTGYRYADLKEYYIAIQVDGDGQHPPDQIHRLLKPVVEGKADMVIGSRFLGEGEYVPSLARSIGIRIFSRILALIAGERVTDPTSGFRAVNREVIRFFAKNYPEDYPEVEAIVLLHKAEFDITEVPVQMKARVWGKSSITYFHAAYYMVKVLLAIFIDMIKTIRRRQ